MTDNKRYSSVSEMIRDTVEDPQCANEFDQLAASRQIIRSLMALRAARRLSQSDIAGKLGCSQSRISKLESSKDADISLGDLMAYAGAVGYDVNLALVDNSQPLVERIRYHALRIGSLLEQLAKLAHSDASIARGVSGFFGEAFFNLLNVLKRAGDTMPKKDDGSPMVKIEILGPDAPDDSAMRRELGEKENPQDHPVEA